VDRSDLIWLRIGTSGGLLWTRWWTFRFHKMPRNSWVAERLAASQEGLSYDLENLQQFIKPLYTIRPCYSWDRFLLLTAEVWVQSQMTSCEICDRWSGIGAFLLPSFFFGFPLY
jgi:hypothetical protein